MFVCQFAQLSLQRRLVFAGRSTTAEILVAVMCTVLVVVILVFGPMVLRNDLRGDLRRLPMLKTLPMKGRERFMRSWCERKWPGAASEALPR